MDMLCCGSALAEWAGALSIAEGEEASAASVHRAVCPTPHCRGIVWASSVLSVRILPCRRCGRLHPPQAFPEVMGAKSVAPKLAHIWDRARTCVTPGGGNGDGALAHELLDAAGAESEAFAALRRFCAQLAEEEDVMPEFWGVRYTRPGESPQSKLPSRTACAARV